MLRKLNKIFTVEELAAIMPRFQGTRKQSHKVGEKLGIPGNYVDTIRTILGYSKDLPYIFDEKNKQEIIEYYESHPEISVGKLYEIFKSKMGLHNKQTVYDMLKRNGIDTKRNHHEWTKIQEMRVLDCKDRRHMTFTQIAALIPDHSQHSIQVKYYNLKGTRHPSRRKKK